MSNHDDKTSACSTPSLSPIKNEPLIIVNPVNRQETPTPLISILPSKDRHSPLLLSSSTNSSVHYSSEKQKDHSDNDDTSLLSFERHELSAGHVTIMTNREYNQHKSNENSSANQTETTIAPSRHKTTTTTDWSYFITVSEGISKELEKPTPSSSTSSSSSSSSNSDPGHSQPTRHAGGLEFFIHGKQQDTPACKLCNMLVFFAIE